MYAVIKSGGKQEKVSVGASVRLELLEGLVGDAVDLRPIMVVDEDNVVVGKELGDAAVKGEIVGGLGIGLDCGPHLDQLAYVATQLLSGRPFGGGPHDYTEAIRLQIAQDLAQSPTLIIGQPLGYSVAVGIGNQYHEAPGKGDLLGEPRPLGSNRILGHLAEHNLAGPQ